MQILLAKGDRHTKMHDHELAFRVLFKAMRILRSMEKQDKALWIHLYELMATAHITQKELIQAHQYTLKARELQLEVGLAEDTRQRERKQAAIAKNEEKKMELMS